MPVMLNGAADSTNISITSKPEVQILAWPDRKTPVDDHTEYVSKTLYPNGVDCAV